MTHLESIGERKGDVLPKDQGLMFPRHAKTRKPTLKASKPEAVTQRQVEAYIGLLGLYSFHMPEFLLNAAFRNRSLSGAELGAAKRASDKVRGLPDLLIFDPKRPGLILSIELKTEIGHITPAQKHWATILGTKFCRSFEAAKMEIDGWRILRERNARGTGLMWGWFLGGMK